MALKVGICKREVIYNILNHILLQRYSTWLDKMLNLEIIWTKVQIPEKVYKKIFSNNGGIQIMCKIDVG